MYIERGGERESIATMDRLAGSTMIYASPLTQSSLSLFPQAATALAETMRRGLARLTPGYIYHTI